MIEPSELTGGTASHRMAGVRLGVRIHRLKFLAVRYWWILALTIVLSLLVQGYRCAQQVARYISSAQMMVNGRVSLPQEQGLYNEELSMFYGTQVALMKSSDTMNQAMDRVRAIHPEIAIDELAKVSAFQEPKTSIFDLQVISSNPDYAKALLDAVIDTYLASKRGRKAQTTTGAVNAITEEIARLDGEIRSDEQQLLDFQKNNNVVFIEEQSTSTATYLVNLNTELARLSKEHDLLSLESKDSAARPDDTSVAPDSSPNGKSAPADLDKSLAAEQENIEKLKISRDEYGTYLKDLHPKMISLAEQISKEEKFLDMLKNRSVESRDAHREDLELQIKNLQQQITDWNVKSLDLNERLGTYQQLKGKITREQTLYDQLASSIQNVNLNKSLDQEDVVTTQSASTPQQIPPDYPKSLGYGFLFGLLSGLSIIYFVNRLDDKIDSPLELEENVELPIVGQVPQARVDKRSKRVPLLTEDDQRHVLIESHRNIRSAILFRASSVGKPRSILISSAVPGEGKSSIAANLAIIFALSGTRTLLIDADLRRGVLHNLFELEDGPGLTDALRGEVSWHDAVQRTVRSNLDVLPRGKIHQQAGDLLLGSAADLILQESISEYDLVIWDSAPLLAADDAANLCSKVDGILFVARVGFSSIHSVRSALQDLSQRNAKVFGIVLNAVKPDQPGYYEKYRYKEYYATVAEV